MSETKEIQSTESARSDGPGNISTKRLRVLLIQGKGFNRLFVALRFRMAGVSVDTTAIDASDLDELLVRAPDALLLDPETNAVSALELVRRIRDDARFGQRPIYVFTSLDSLTETAQAACRAHGVRIFDRRSVTSNSLVQTIIEELTRAESGSAPQPAKAGEQPTKEAPAEPPLEGSVQKPAPESSFPGNPGRQAGSGSQSVASTPSGETGSLPGASQTKDNPVPPKVDSLDTPPLPPGEPAMTTPAGTARSAGRSERMLLFVEDDPFALKVYSKALRRAGLHVEVAQDGAAALAMLPDLKPDLVILDLMLPRLPGMEVLKFIRGNAGLKDTPVLVLSNAFVNRLSADALAAGANRTISKGLCSPAKLLEQVCELLGELPSPALPQPVTHFVQPVSPSNQDEEFAETAIWTRQDGLRKRAPAKLGKIRQACLDYIKEVDAQKSEQLLTELYRRVRFLSAHCSLIGFTKIAEVSSALEGLLFELLHRHTDATSSLFQTIAQAVDLLDRLLQNNDTTFSEPRIKHKVLVVDDDPVCTTAFVNALKRGNFEAVGTHDPLESIRLLKSDSFDLVLLDVHMPNLDGFEVCEQLRRMPQHESIPVVFITANAEFRNRARSVIAGGDDLVAKPVSPLELLLKVTMHLLKTKDKPTAGPQAASAVNETKPVQSKPEISWSIDDILNKPQNTSITQQAPLPPGSVEPAPALANAPRFSCEPPNRLETAPARTDTEREILNLAPAAITDADSLAPDEVGPSGGQPSRLTTAPSRARPQAQAGNTQQSEALRKDGGRLAERDPERELLAGKLFTLANDLHRVRARLQRKTETIDKLKKRLDELSSAAESPGQSPRACVEMPQAAAEEVEELRAEVRIENLEKELQESRRITEELTERFAHEESTSAEFSRQVEELEAQLERARADSETQAQQHSRAQSDLRAQLESVEAARTQAQSRIQQLEDDLAESKQLHQETTSNLGTQQEAGAESSLRVRELEAQLGERTAQLEHVSADSETQAQQHSRAQSDLRAQLESAEAARADAQSRIQQLEDDLAESKQLHQEITSNLGRQQEAGVESSLRVGELEAQLGERTAQLERARADSETQAQQHSRVQSDLRAQLESAEVARNQAQSKIQQLENDLAESKRLHRESTSRLGKEHESVADFHAQMRDLKRELEFAQADLGDYEGRLNQSVARIARVTADLAQEKGARQRSEERALALDLRVRELHEELTRLLQLQSSSQERMVALESQVAQRDELIAQRTADLNQEQADRQITAEHLQKALDLNDHLRKSLSFLEAAQKRSDHIRQDLEARLEATLNRLQETDAQLQGESGERQWLAATLEAAQQELRTIGQKRDALETELRTTLQALEATEAKLVRETTDRQRLQEAFESAQANFRDRSQRAELEITRLHAALESEQVERKRQQMQVVQIRQITLRAARDARLLRNTLRKQVREPMDAIGKATRTLLQLEMTDEQRKCAEDILCAALLVQARLEEPQLACANPAA